MADVGYIRVSSHDQNSDRQLASVHLDKKFEDKQSGASGAKRPALEECFNYLRAGDTLHVHSIDRLARSVIDLQQCVNRCRLKEVTLIFHQEKMTFSVGAAASAIQVLQLHLLGAFAEFERKLLLERQREGISAAKKRGKKFGRPKKITQELEQTLAQRLKAGELPADLAKEFELSVSSVYALRKKFEQR